MRLRFPGTTAGMIVVLLWSTPASAQDDAIFDAKGFQQNRDYFSQQPFEHIDTLGGGLILTFTDLVLPGNAGRDVRFQRSYNSKGGWTFGIAGLPMYVREFDWPLPNPIPPPPFDPKTYRRPRLVTSDGEQSTEWMDPPSSNPSSMRWVTSSRFWRYDRVAGIAYLPDGTICRYDSEGRLTQAVDPFGNVIALTWDVGTLQVRQDLGASQSRTVNIAIDAHPVTWLRMPLSLEFNGRTWTYAYDTGACGCAVGLLNGVTPPPPIGPGWSFAYNARFELNWLRTPQGGEISYAYGDYQFERNKAGQPNPVQVLSRVVLTRSDGAGTSTYVYSRGSDGEHTTIETPTHAHMVYVHNLTVSEAVVPPDGEWGVRARTVISPAGEVLEQEARDYIPLPVGYESAIGGLQRQIIQRSSRSYTTIHDYRAVQSADFHRPYQTTETGELQRVTVRTFDYGFNLARDGLPYFNGRVASETVTVGGESFTTSNTYNHSTGFTLSETDYGVTTMFAPDVSGSGNVASVTKANGHTTSFSYQWGIVSGIQTPEHSVTRSINPEGTVEWETRGGRTTRFSYDALFRIANTQPPGGTNPIITEYDNAGGIWVRVRRGDAWLKTTLDGFGRPIATENSVGVKTTTRYDAEGRKTKEGYPFIGSNDIGVDITYDALGRVTRRTNPDGSFSENSYDDGAGRITFRDENSHKTVHTRQAFGNPDEARLTSLTDANDKVWGYTYNALGKLRGAVAPDGATRSWVYDSRNLLVSETHPESGTTTYPLYDLAGNLKRKIDANGTQFDYTYDGNDRLVTLAAGDLVTTLTYEAGTDNRKTASAGPVSSTFSYDTAGRLNRRVDVVDTNGFTTTFGYDGNDNVANITYPSMRQIGYEFDSENRIKRVYDVGANRNYATEFSYHPSQAIASFTAGNGFVHQTTFDEFRYWVTGITSGALQLTYGNYDAVGNVRVIGDNRSGMTQTFGYDVLDRLQTANGLYGSIAYDYDAHGNRQSNATATYGYDAVTLRLSSQNGNTFTYDNNGNVWTAPNATYSYTPHNLMATALAGGTTVAVGTTVTRRPPHRTVRAGLLHTAPALDAWRQTARSDEGGESWHSESSVGPARETAPKSSDDVGPVAEARGTKAEGPGYGRRSDDPCCPAPRGSSTSPARPSATTARVARLVCASDAEAPTSARGAWLKVVCE